MDFIHYKFPSPAYCNEISLWTIPYSPFYNASWIEQRGEVLVVFDCEDGLVVILKEPKKQ